MVVRVNTSAISSCSLKCARARSKTVSGTWPSVIRVTASVSASAARSTNPVARLCLNRGEQLIEPNPVEHLRPNAVDDSEGYLGSVLRRIDVHAKRALAKWRIDNLRN